VSDSLNVDDRCASGLNPGAGDELVATIEYQGKGTIQVDGQPCTLTKYRISNNYQTSGERIPEDPEVLVEPWVMTPRTLRLNRAPDAGLLPIKNCARFNLPQFLEHSIIATRTIMKNDVSAGDFVPGVTDKTAVVSPRRLLWLLLIIRLT
jgi:hypothetical protein